MVNDGFAIIIYNLFSPLIVDNLQWNNLEQIGANIPYKKILWRKWHIIANFNKFETQSGLWICQYLENLLASNL